MVQKVQYYGLICGYSENERVNVGSRDSVSTNSTRKSMQFNKGTVQSNLSDSKGNFKDSEKDKGKEKSSSVRRKALADVSNVQGNCSSTSMLDSSKLVDSLGHGTIVVCASSRKPSMGKVETNLSQGAADCKTSKRAGAKCLMTSSNDQRTKDQDHEFVSNAPRTVKLSHVLTRKSLLVIKRVDKVDTSDVKDNAENSEQGKGKSSFLVKTKVIRKVVPSVSNSRTNFNRNRVSDGFKASN